MSADVFEGVLGVGVTALGAVGWSAFTVAWLRSRTRAALLPLPSALSWSVPGRTARPNQEPDSALVGFRISLAAVALGVVVLPLLGLLARVGLRGVIVQLVMAGGTLTSLLLLATAPGTRRWSNPRSTALLLVILGSAILIGAWLRFFG